MGLPRFLGVRHPDCETEGSPGHEADAAADSSDSGPTKASPQSMSTPKENVSTAEKRNFSPTENVINLQPEM